jgi:hypothetical protein
VSHPIARVHWVGSCEFPLWASVGEDETAADASHAERFADSTYAATRIPARFAARKAPGHEWKSDETLVLAPSHASYKAHPQPFASVVSWGN